MKRLAIIGGGAAGLAAAVAAARDLQAAGVSAGARDPRPAGAARRASCAGPVEVSVYEADDRVGRSILATGNGRCNFSNARVEAWRYRGADLVGRALAGLQAQCAARSKKTGMRAPEGDAVHEFFADLGLVWREEGEGRLYPLSNKASSVRDPLRSAALCAGVRELCGHAAARLDAPGRAGGPFSIRFADGAVAHADAVVLAVGGRAIGKMELPKGLSCSPGRPLLGPLRTETAVVRPLDGIRVRCAIELVRPDQARASADLRGDENLHEAALRAAREHARNAGRSGEEGSHADGRGLLLAREVGELLFRDYGVSGIAVFNLSRFAEPGDRLYVDLLPGVRACDVEGFLFARRKRMAAPGRRLDGDAFMCGMLAPQLGRAVLAQAGLSPAERFEKPAVQALAPALKGLAIRVSGQGGARQCQVARGGVPPQDLDAATMEVKGLQGLYVVGEALDVDAPCGGYNLHWAWASGMLAGCAAAARLGGCAS